MKIVIDDKIPFIRGAFERWADVVYSRGPAIDAHMVADADALIVRTRTKCNRDLLVGSSVRIVASATIGYDHFDTPWLEQQGIKWANAPGCNSGSVMQYVTSALFFLARKHSLDLRTLTLGIAGVGNVGSQVAHVARSLGMRVLLNDPPRQRREEGTEFHPLSKLLEESDILTLHVPLTREGEDKTFHLIGSHNLASMKRSAILINSSRGEVVDNIALRDALSKGNLHGAALDVWEGEPETDPELVALVDIATPHIAGYSVDGKANATISSVRIVAAELGLPLQAWTPAELPLPNEPVIDLTAMNSSGRAVEAMNISGRAVEAGNSVNERGIGGSPGSMPVAGLPDLVARAVHHTYPIEEDDRLFRKSREKFEYLRDNYRVRREFSSYGVRTTDREAAQIMADIGFHIIE